MLKFSKTKLKLIRVGAIAAIAGIIVGVVGTLFVSNYNPPDERSFEDATVVFGRIQSQNELVSVSQDYNITDKAKDTNTFFNLFDIPFTENSFWYRYTGTIKAGVNLETADIDQQGTNVSITLDPPYIISNEPDMDRSGVLEENNNLVNPIHVEDVDEFQRMCIEQSEENALEGGLLDDARNEAESRLSNLFYVALGDGYTVTFSWRETSADAPEGPAE